MGRGDGNLGDGGVFVAIVMVKRGEEDQWV